MAQRGVPSGWDSPSDRPSVLQITVESTPRRPRPTGRRAHVLIGIAIAVLAAIAACFVIGTHLGGDSGSAPPPVASPPPPAPQQPSVLVDSGPPSALTPGLYRFPVGCSYSKAIAVERNRPGPCTPHAGAVTVVLRRARGAWKVTFELTSSSCSPMPVPPLARGKVKACPR